MLRSLPALCLLAALLVTACAEAPSSADPAPSAAADSAFALLESMQRDAMQQAFPDARQLSYLRLTRTEQLTGGGVAAYSERVVRLHPDAPPTTVRIDTGGTFDFGWFSRFVDDQESAAPANPADHMLPEDPAFLTARNREAFAYDVGPDTLWLGRPVRIVTVRARPDAGERQSIRRARLYIDRATQQLVGFRLERRDETWFYDETSRLDVRLRPADDAWLPLRTDVLTAVRLPFSTARTFHSTSTYYPDPDAP